MGVRGKKNTWDAFGVGPGPVPSAGGQSAGTSEELCEM